MFKFFCFLCLFSTQVFLFAQLNQPRSTLGFGDPLPLANAALRGMGGISNAVVDYYGVNLVNPATYGYVYKGTYRRIALDIGSNVRLQNTTEKGMRFQGISTNITHVSLRFPLARSWGLVLAFQPLATVRSSVQTMLRRNTVSGSQNQILTGIGYNVQKWSIGFNVGYLFGQKQGTSTSLTVMPTRTRSQDFYQGIDLRGGILFAQRLKTDPENISHTYFKAGATFSAMPFLRSTQTTHNDLPLGLNFIPTDTLNGGVAIRHTPLKMGLGLVLEKEFSWLVGIDANFEKWKGFSYGNEHVKDGAAYQNIWELRVGSSFTPNYKAKEYLKHIPIKIGGLVGTYPLLFDGTSIFQWGLTAGFSVPLKKNSYTNQTSLVHFSFEFINRNASAFKEVFFNFILALSLNDLWFIKSYQQ